MNLLAIFVLVVSSVVLTLQARKFYGAWLNPISAFCVLSLFHNWIGSLIGVFVDIEWGVNSPEQARTAVLFVNAVGLWCFALGAWLVRNSGSRHQNSAVRTRIPLVRVFEWGYCAIAGFMLALPFVMAGGFARGYGEGQAAHAPTSTNFAQLLNVRQALLIAGYTTSTLQGRKRPLFYIGAFCFEVLLSVLSGGRKALIITAAGLLIVYASTHRVRLAATLRTTFVLLVIGMAGTGMADLDPFLAILPAARHGPLPVGPVPVLDAQGDGRARGAAVHYAALQSRPVVLDAHPPPTAKALLPPPQLGVDLAGSQGQPGRHPLQDGGQSRQRHD